MCKTGATPEREVERVGREDALRDGVRRVTAHFKDVDDRSLAAESGVRGTAPY